MMDLDATKINGDPQPPDEINSIFDETKTIISSLGISFNWNFLPFKKSISYSTNYSFINGFSTILEFLRKFSF